MLVLAEIGDKMWTPGEMLLWGLLFAAIASAPGLIRWWLGIPSAVLAIYGSYALWMEMRAPGMWPAVMNELGWSWVVGTLVAWNTGFAVCWCGLFAAHRYCIRVRRIDAGLCVQCGYNLTGNVSGICPECGGHL